MKLGLGITVLASAHLLATSGARTFEDTFGRTIEAELVSHWGVNTGSVKINRGGKELVVAIKNFSVKDQKEINEWITENPELLAPLVDPPKSGDGVLSGSKWMYLRGRTPITIEFKGAGALNKNGIASKSGRWDINFDEALTMKWDGIPRLTFDKALVGGKVYADERHGVVMARLDRLPAPATEQTVKGKSFLLVHPQHLERWTGNKTKNVALVEFKDDGKAMVDGEEFEWTIASGSIQIKHHGGYAAFGGCARDMFIDSKFTILWEVAPPPKK